jgi:hypothetical protein
MGIIQGVSTWGNTNNHITLGVGYIIFSNDFLPPVVSFSGCVKLIKRIGLVSENWLLFLGEQFKVPSIVSLGVRYIGNRSTVDIAFFSDAKFSGELPLPYFSYSFKPFFNRP